MSPLRSFSLKAALALWSAASFPRALPPWPFGLFVTLKSADVQVGLALPDTRWAAPRVNNLAGFPPDSAVGPFGRSRKLHPLVPRVANGGAIGDEFAPWFSFGDRTNETDVLGGVGALLHMLVDNSPDGFNLIALGVNLHCCPSRA